MPPTVLATICARAGSKGLPGKNIRLLEEKSLLEYAIDCARSARSVSHIVISTDSDEIASVAKRAGLPVPFRRPAELANDSSAKVLAIRHATEYVEQNEGFMPDIVVDLDVGVPLRDASDVDACVDRVWRGDVDAAVTVYESERNPYFNMVEFDGDRVQLVKRPSVGVVCRQDAPPVFSVSPSVFAYRRDALGLVMHLYEGCWGGVIVPRERAIDIDHEIDFQFVQFLMAMRKARS